MPCRFVGTVTADQEHAAPEPEADKITIRYAQIGAKRERKDLKVPTIVERTHKMNDMHHMESLRSPLFSGDFLMPNQIFYTHSSLQ